MGQIGFVGLDDEVVEVAAHFARGAIAGDELITGDKRAGGRQQAQLDAAADGQLFLHALPAHFFLDEPPCSDGHDIHHPQGKLRRPTDQVAKTVPVEADQAARRGGRDGGAARLIVDHRHLAQNHARPEVVDLLAVAADDQFALQYHEHLVAHLILAHDDRPGRQVDAALIQEKEGALVRRQLQAVGGREIDGVGHRENQAWASVSTPRFTKISSFCPSSVTR